MTSTPIAATSGYCVVIPTYNNHATVVQVVRQVRQLVQTVIVVDDGCTDGTAELLNDEAVVVVRHARNHGKGVALRTGFKKALDLGYTHAITIDSDGQHYPQEIPKLVEASRQQPDAVVIGYRDMSGAHVPNISTFGRQFSNFWLRLATGAEPGDSQCGFRCYPLRHVTRVSCWSRRFTYECETLIRMAWGGCPIINTPIKVYYPPKETRVSHFDPVWDNVRYFFLYVYMNFRHLLVPLPHRKLVRSKEPLWQGSIGATIRGVGARVRKAAALPEAAQLKGGPIARVRQLGRFLMKEKNSPGELAMAVAIGAFMGCTPLIGFQWLLALYAATRVHVNRIACVAASNISFGPLTVVYAFISIALGKLMLGQSFALPAWNHYAISTFLRHSTLAWALGCVVFGLVMAFATGLATLYGVRALRRRKAASVPAPAPISDPAIPTIAAGTPEPARQLTQAGVA
ncbi:MAG: DUF2062 domain-containing protein [Planctomycetes bacterium]|nr:DUF2062 domain-containing protein [Planctomycetota bacterium]